MGKLYRFGDEGIVGNFIGCINNNGFGDSSPAARNDIPSYRWFNGGIRAFSTPHRLVRLSRKCV